MTDALWSEDRTTPEAIDRALRELVHRRHMEDGGFVPARTLNMVCFIDADYAGEVANRLRQVGRYEPSRLIILAYDHRRSSLQARVNVAAAHDPAPGELALLHESVQIRLGERHMDDLLTIVDPLVITDVPTLLWSPHGHREAIDALAPLAQSVLIDSAAEPIWREALDGACALAERLYVVDLAWVRPAPWRERIAAAFARPSRRAELGAIAAVTVRHHPDFCASALLLLGWLASRLQWRVEPLTTHGSAPSRLAGKARSRRQEVALAIEPDSREAAPGLAGVTLSTASGRSLSLDRGAGGLHAHERTREGEERRWIILGASRGEGGVLGQGIRQALLRDLTYRPALGRAREMIPA
ncbi:MAG TPA: glucose-6-phosphate dehydrogenase assembly protein OpcA [Solirubrobacteraceae bacterium]|nr:glucose-6-phosphate dehydrogenase assembly protein OpcA [Solirubrobacteraceae bacterium]